MSNEITCPVMGNPVGDPATAPRTEYKGTNYYFCCPPPAKILLTKIRKNILTVVPTSRRGIITTITIEQPGILVTV